MSNRIGIIEGAAHQFDIDYSRDVRSLVESIVMPESARNQILSVVDQHDQSKNAYSRIEVRDVNFTDNVSVSYAAKRIRRHSPDNHWQPLGLMELLYYVKRVPGVYLNRMVYALGHIYEIGNDEHILSVTDCRGVVDFELLKLRHNQQFSFRSVFPEFRVIG